MTDMTWQTHWGLIKPRAELLDATGKIIGGIEWLKWTGTLALGSIGHQRWTMKRVGFFQTRVVIREEGSNQDLATYHPSWMTTGVLHLAGGPVYRLHSKGAFQWDWHWTVDGLKQPLISFHIKSWLNNSKAEVEVSQEGHACTDRDLLTLVAWYLLVMASQDAAAATAH